MIYVAKRAKDLGIPRVDATKPFTMVVKGLDIKRAQSKNSKECAFSRACKRTQGPQLKKAYFFRTTAWLEYANKMVRYSIPDSAQKEIVSFDRAGTMEPGTYYLKPPKSAWQMDAIARRNAIRTRTQAETRGKKVIRRRPMQHRTTGVRTLFEPQVGTAK